MINLKNRVIQQLISQLTEEGAAAIKQAYETRDWRNRTFNLHDSYGSAVYVNGQLLKSTIRYVGGELAEKEWSGKHKGRTIMMNGREEINNFFTQYTPKTNGVELIIVAAMFYANILEAGGGGIKRKYHVISQANGIMNGLASKYVGKVNTVELGRVLSVS